MAKRLGIPPKIVEPRVSVQAEAKEKLWDAVPMLAGEKLYLWFPRAARELKNAAIAAGIAKEVAQRWTPRRVRAFWNGEARRIDHIEIRTLNQRIASAKAAENRHQEEANEIRITLAAGSDGVALDGRAPQRMRDEMASPRGVVPRSTD